MSRESISTSSFRNLGGTTSLHSAKTESETDIPVSLFPSREGEKLVHYNAFNRGS